MKPSPRKLLVTSALPYANGPLHLGHLVEHIQTDIWVRFQRMTGAKCIAVCGADAHGTPIMIKAEQLGIRPEQLVNEMQQQQQQDFADFYIHYDNYYTTHSEENRRLSQSIYQQLKSHGDISTRTIEQAYDPEKQMFLPDRYVKGECPSCGAEDQYGDSCEACGATYMPTDLIHPKSTISGCAPIQKSSEHYFFHLKHYQDFLKQWLHTGELQAEMVNKLQEWFDAGLQDWDISRDAPYFGIDIPDATDKYFYVWLDAPIGYMASVDNFCQHHAEYRFDDFWQPDSDWALYHFVGKDIIYFHALFWPAILHAAGFRIPNGVFAHGFLTINGQKMSKSRGTFIKARTYLDHLSPEHLRYYFAAKLGDGVEDIDLHFNDFLLRINSDLVGKVVNIASRCASFIHKRFSSRLAAECPEPILWENFVNAGDLIAECYQQRQYHKAVKHIMNLADQANRYIDTKKPWVLIKDISTEKQVQDVCSLGLNLFRLLLTYLKPILPATAQQVEQFLNIPEMTWDNRRPYLADHKINPFTPLMQRVEMEKINAMQHQTEQEIRQQTSGGNSPLLKEPPVVK